MLVASEEATAGSGNTQPAGSGSPAQPPAVKAPGPQAKEKEGTGDSREVTALTGPWADSSEKARLMCRQRIEDSEAFIAAHPELTGKQLEKMQEYQASDREQLGRLEDFKNHVERSKGAQGFILNKGFKKHDGKW